MMKRLVYILSLLGMLTGNCYASEIDSSKVSFSVTGGIYQNTITIELSSFGDGVYYTLDGSKPSSSSKKYNEPILVDKTTVVRAVAYYKGKGGETVTNSYFLGRSFDMAVISLSCNPDDFFSYERGIYSKGCCADSVPPYKGANFWKGWERKVNIEFYEPTGELAFNQEAGARIFGGFSKGLPMKSLAIIARKKYGKKRIKYKIFPDKDIDKFKSIVLRNSGSDFNNTQFRDAFITNLVSPLDIEIQASRPAVVFINGEYWGVHNVREKINEYYLKSNCGANPDSVDIMKHRNDLLAGKRDHYLAMKKYMEKTDFSDTNEISKLNKLMDINNFINYNITEVYVDNRDAGGNIRYWRPQNTEGRWRWILFDTDISFGISDWKAYQKNTLDKMTNKHNEIWPDPPWSTFIIRKLLENDSVRNIYINRFSDHLNTIFSEEYVIAKIDSMRGLYEKEMPYHYEKWRGSNLERWDRNINKMKDFARKRPSFVRAHLMERFALTDTFTLEVDCSKAIGGKVLVNSMDINGEFSGVYFVDVPVNIKAVANDGYEFDRWEVDGEKESNLRVTENKKLVPIFKKKALSTYSSQIVLNEISVSQDSTENYRDWIELYNSSTTKINLENWTLIESGDRYYFSETDVILPNGYLLISRDPKKMKESFQNISFAKKRLKFGLSSKKGRIILLDSEAFVVDSLSYKIKKDFPELENLARRSFERVNPSLKQWKSSVNQSPGGQNDLYVKVENDKEEDDSKVNYGMLVGGGILAIGLLLVIVFFFRKKKSS